MIYFLPMKTSVKHICISTFLRCEYGRQLLIGLGDEQIEQRNWVLHFLDCDELTPARLQNFDGYIGDIRTPKLAIQLSRLKIPVVDLMHIQDFPYVFPSVRTDHNVIGKLAAEHFLGHRHERFAFCGFRGIAFSDFRREAFCAHIAAAGFTVLIYTPKKQERQVREVITDDPAVPASDLRALRAWVRSLPKPIAVFCCNDDRAQNILSICRQLDISVPDDVAILGVDNDPLSCLLSNPQISSIDPNAREAGRQAIRLLAQQFERKTLDDSERIRMIAPTGIKPRASTESYPVEPKWLSDALSFISRNATRGISAADVFTHLGYSHTLVQRTFKKALNTTVQREIAAVRLAEARRLLKTGNLLMSEVAKLSGFASTEYFYQCYTAAFGAPPSRRSSDQESK